MKPTVTVLAVVIALIAGAGAAAASTRTDDDKKEIQGTHQVSAQLPGMVPDPSAGTIRVVGEPRAVHRVLDADGKVVRSEQVKVEFGPYGEGERGPNAQQVGNYACVVSNTDNPDLQVYQPMALTSDGTSHFTQFIYHLYGLNAARRVEGEL